MAFTYTDQNKKTVQSSLGDFKAVVTEAVETGDLVSWYDTDATSALQFADQSDSQPAQAVALEDVAAGEEGKFALAAVLTAPDTPVGTLGIVTQTYFGASSDYYGVALYLGESGKPASAQGGTYVQLVGYNINRFTIVLQPNTALTGVAGSFTTLAASGAVTLTATTDASNATTAAVTITGGLGVAKKLFVGTDINTVAGNVRLGAISTFGSTEPVSWAVFKTGTAPIGAITTSGGIGTNGTVMQKIIADGTVSTVG